MDCMGMDRMATLPELSMRTEPGAGVELYIARQPILDAHGHVHGYKLLFRNGPGALLRGDGGTASCAMLDDTVLLGLERYSNGLPCFVNCTVDALTQRGVQVLPASMTVLVIPAGAEPTPELIEACLELMASGFRLALDGFAWKPELQPVAERADYIAVDFSLLDAAARDKVRRQLSRIKAAKIATKVETQEDYQQASAASFTLFEGAYFCQSSLLKKGKAAANRFFHFELLRHLNRDPIELKKVAELVLRDAALTFRLLRMVNSPICAIQREVTSIEAALLILGEQTFRRIATLAILSELNTDQPQEILQMALLRARFCALAAEQCALDPGEQYLIGLLSLLPAMLGLPMEALTPSLPLRSEIRDALEGTANPERCLLAWLELHEHGNWTACDAITETNSLNVERLVRSYGDAIDWAKETLRSAA
jgi:EAL and modified HD-GYP domain-containing signal transduction protein